MTIEHIPTQKIEYERIQKQLEHFTEEYADLPIDISDKLKLVLNENFFDLSQIKLKLFTDYKDEKWSVELLLIIQSLASNEIFVDVEKRQIKNNPKK